MRKTTLLKLLKIYQIQLGSIIMILFLFILIIKMLIPNFKRAYQLNQNIREMKVKVSTLRQKDERLSAISELKYKLLLPKIVKVLPNSKDYVSLFTTFDELQSKTDVSILRTDLQFGNLSGNTVNQKNIDSSGTFTVPISIQALGDIDQISLFLNSLADFSGRLILVDDVKLEVEENLIKASISGNAYFDPQTFTIGNLDSPLPLLSEEGEKIIAQIMTSEEIAVDSADSKDINIGNNTLFY